MKTMACGILLMAAGLMLALNVEAQRFRLSRQGMTSAQTFEGTYGLGATAAGLSVAGLMLAVIGQHRSERRT